MIIVGLTGGIGSGKTTVAKLFESLNIPIYIADVEAKLLMNTSTGIKEKLVELFGEKAYLNDELNRPFIADTIFNNKSYLKKMNAIVHPEVGTHFKQWLAQQNSPYVIKEAAIIFEHQKQSQYDLIISVIADEDKRLQRVINRDQSTPEKVLAIMKNQMSDIDKVKLSDFVIVNNDKSTLKKQVQKIHKSILKHIKNTTI
ncbi:dephospho-CoA kinase [Psychroserpens mesophilus]|uniref:dephospho-CoA kinase n=1 Tax=Psychroserpens mesophilus TaxID=325473 RepID=UPI003D65092C